MKPIFESAASPPDDNSIQRKCAGCAQEEKTIQSKAISEEEEPLQAKAASSPNPSLESRLQSTTGANLPYQKIPVLRWKGLSGRISPGYGCIPIPLQCR